ncbi:MAG: 16S rRNA (guanine(966)-N(2))-methyltransferase RsmD [Clostridiales bacterium]|jgi:16S rRNA (guanine(966)-N(2))-methyltransferase RsmD|nr:16S rRNA (guanine(966)-N(2))-methyltransferase RsmD [Clostridiales bacterium]
MRIIAGKHRGRKLYFPLDKTVRPTGDRAKEALFCILQFEIAGSVVLDLFSGSGAIGLEFISRGAERVIFCDIDARYVKKNLALAGETGEEILEGDYLKTIKKLSDRGDRFDFIYLDPPYKSGYGEKAIKVIIENNLLKTDGKIIFEHYYGKDLIDLTEYAIIYDTRVYGTQQMSFIKPKKL